MKPTAGVGAAEREVADGARAHDAGDGGKLARQDPGKMPPALVGRRCPTWGSDTCMASTRLGSSPGSTSNRVARLRIMSPAPPSTTSASAISTVMSARRVPAASRVAPRSPSRSDGCRDPRRSPSSGANAKSSADNPDASTANISTRASSVTGTSPRNGRLRKPGARMPSTSCVMANAIATPLAQPSAATSRPSIKTCRARCP